ncbi:MAG: hypothetical protein QXL49_01365 [Acidilobaceae archaeon]
MGWTISENRLSMLINMLMLVSGVACAIVSTIYILVVVLPVYYFHGYIQGYYSILDYRLYYIVDQQPVSMQHTDYIRHVSLSFTVLSLTILSLSILSIVLSRGRATLAAGLAFGCSSALILLYGLFNGYIYRAMELDLARFRGLLGDIITMRTTAGNITFTGVRLEQAGVLGLALNNWIMLMLIAIAVVASYASVLLVSMRLPKHILRHSAWYGRIGQGLVYTMTAVLVLSSLASIFSYYPSSLVIVPQPPPATLEQSQYTYTCTDLARTSRGALTNTDFEEYPISGWTNYGGNWELSTGGGFKGNALRGRDNNRGVGASSQYYWNTRIDGYTSLWVSVKVRAETIDGRKGIGLLNADRNRLYEISVSNGLATIRKYDGSWVSIGSSPVSGYSATRWYTLVLHYNVTAARVSFRLWVYDDTGTLVSTLSASDVGGTRFTPAYAGVTIDAPPASWFRFDDFIISTVDPRIIMFTGFYTGMRVKVWDNLGNLVSSETTTATSFTLDVTRDIVVGTGVDGRIAVEYPDAYLCGTLTVPSTDAILGGDTYALTTASISVSLGSNKTSASLTLKISGTTRFNTTARVLQISTSQILYARLILDSASALPTLNLNIWIEGATSSTSIIIKDGVPIADSTSLVQLNLGAGNSISISGYFTATDQLATLNLKLKLCTVSNEAGACIYYPIVLSVNS